MSPEPRASIHPLEWKLMAVSLTLLCLALWNATQTRRPTRPRTVRDDARLGEPARNPNEGKLAGDRLEISSANSIPYLRAKPAIKEEK